MRRSESLRPGLADDHAANRGARDLVLFRERTLASPSRGVDSADLFNLSGSESRGVMCLTSRGSGLLVHVRRDPGCQDFLHIYRLAGF